VARALEAVELTPVETYLERRPHELSGGQRQRVAIAASLVLEPELLVADEPVSMLDVSVRAGVLRVLDGLRERGIGILIITHDLSTAAHFADRIAVMYLGRIVEEGSAREVIRRPRHPYTAALISAVPNPDPRQAQGEAIVAGETPDATRVPSGCRFHPRCPVRVEVCPRLDPPLAQAREAAPGHRAACVHAYPPGSPHADSAVLDSAVGG
jgi:peptide/nickel transport system ATP-binding protein